MKIYLDAYMNGNLGDDLFIDILLKRYKSCDFFSVLPKNNYLYDNLQSTNSNLIYKIVDKFNLYNFYRQKCDFTIVIGGSMYIEANPRKEIGKRPNKYFVIGSNYGPYKTKEYFNNSKKFFEDAEDVCFREKYSYNLFKDLKNVRYAPDIVFSLDCSYLSKINTKKKVIISLIDCKIKYGEKYTNLYEDKIIELIQILKKKGYEICLMSFCKNQGDEEAINRICNKTKEKVETYFYRGNIKEALEKISESQVVIGSRFHAMILGLLFNKKILPINYSDKLNHVFEDYKIKSKIINIKDLETEDLEKTLDENLAITEDIQELRKNSQKQFEKIDKFVDYR